MEAVVQRLLVMIHRAWPAASSPNSGRIKLQSSRREQGVCAGVHRSDACCDSEVPRPSIGVKQQVRLFCFIFPASIYRTGWSMKLDWKAHVLHASFNQTGHMFGWDHLLMYPALLLTFTDCPLPPGGCHRSGPDMPITIYAIGLQGKLLTILSHSHLRWIVLVVDVKKRYDADYHPP